MVAWVHLMVADRVGNNPAFPIRGKVFSDADCVSVGELLERLERERDYFQAKNVCDRSEVNAAH